MEEEKKVEQENKDKKTEKVALKKEKPQSIETVMAPKKIKTLIDIKEALIKNRIGIVSLAVASGQSYKQIKATFSGAMGHNKDFLLRCITAIEDLLEERKTYKS